MRVNRIVLPFFLLSVVATAACAGPLRDKLAELRGGEKDMLGDVRGGAAVWTAPAGMVVTKNISYGSDPLQRFDVYASAATAKAGKAPVIFMVHGGGWRTGDKAMRNVVGNKVTYWTARGFVVVAANYRLMPAADPLAQARDVAQALAVAEEQAASWGGDRKRFILMGHSSGAHLVALLASKPELAPQAAWLATVALDSAVYDTELLMGQRHFPLYDKAFGTDQALWKAASPYAALVKAGQPLLAVCSSRRADSCAQAQRYAAKAVALGMRVQVLSEDLSHMEIADSLGLESAYTTAVDAFVRGVLTP